MEFQSYYSRFLEKRSFHDRLFEDEELKNISALTKTEALLPMLVNYFVIYSIFFPKQNTENGVDPYHGRLKDNLHEVVYKI
jgi:hypothetical protein